MPSRSILLASALLTLVPSVAVARDGLAYVGLEGGAVKPERLKLDYQRNAITIPDGLTFKHKTGFDVDFIAGYDLGLIRAEAELGYKRATQTGLTVSPAVGYGNTGPLDVDGRTRALSAMANMLLDFGKDDGLQVYGGGGLGVAKVSFDNVVTGPGITTRRAIDGNDRSFAWQLIAGMRVPVSYNVDLGLKYRYFRTEVDYRDASNPTLVENLEGRFRTHSILASLILNLGSPPAPVAPPVAVVEQAPQLPPPPATQTCPDGSVILATDACPSPPPPPPPPAPAPERG